jgi:hypothetical protein
VRDLEEFQKMLFSIGERASESFQMDLFNGSFQ